ncbi:peptide chain release factor N(5)-glutamine methyltransferase [Comamonas composti]|uniref:peptide chain release factor N(5)-glutamine methyltransferase n=1 Tax=Comamonas composti TaxID=408558 RepID=UPI000413100D|nr:peptide chain release factor N(5)-glutamine methyltransferase [Comamonas composti]
MSSSSPPPTIALALQQAAAQGLARIDAQILLLHALDRSEAGRAWLITHDTEPLTLAQAALWQDLCRRRLDDEPVAYLTGHKEFFGLNLQVDARVLDPRPDTETLVEWALDLMPEEQAMRVVDLGTGSGAIALALKSQRPQARVLAVDASEQALAVAQANAERLQLALEFARGSWLEPLAGERFALIVSNPPYIREDDEHMPALRHEPRQALTSGADGLDDLRAIVAQAAAHLERGGWLLMEHGWDQAQAVAALLEQSGFTRIEHRQDLSGTARCTGGQWPLAAAA